LFQLDSIRSPARNDKTNPDDEPDEHEHNDRADDLIP